jgi:mRNA-degrading endonuclease RelE of RelBE toxin-antitoxin system
MKIKAERTFLKDLKKIKDNKIRAKIQEAVEAIEGASSVEEIKNLERLKGNPDFYRLKFDYRYRLGLRIDDDTVELLRVGSREGFYNSFP